jgi:hypothetical protein
VRLHAHAISLFFPFPIPRLGFLFCRELSTCTTGVDAAEEELGRASSTLAALRKTAEDKEREVDLARVELLKAAVRALSVAARSIGQKRRAKAPVATIREVDPVSLTLLAPGEKAPDVSDGEEEPDDEALGIEVDGGQSVAQTAAVELLTAERDLLTEELNVLAARTGTSADIGPLPPLDAEAADEDDADAAGTAGDSTPSANAVPASSVSVAAPSSSSPPSPSDAAGAASTSASASASILSSFATGSSSAGADAAAEDASAGPSSLLSSFGVESVGAGADVVSAGGFDGGSSIFAGLGSSSASSEPAIPEVSGFGLPGFGIGTPGADTVNVEIGDADDAEEGAGAGMGAGAASGADAEAARLEELQTLARVVSNVYAAVQEKNGIIEEAVGREDFETAGESVAICSWRVCSVWARGSRPIVACR